MATPSENGDYITATFQIWWSPKHPDQIHLTSDDPDFHHPNTERGARFTASSNIRSVNYYPSNFNRLARALAQHGKSHPEECPEGPRRLDQRGFVRADRPSPTVADLRARLARIRERQIRDWETLYADIPEDDEEAG